VLVAAAVCPHPPLLVPEVAAGAAAETEGLRQACLTAVGRLYDASAELLVVVGNGPIAGTARPAETGSLAGFGVPVEVALGPHPDDGPATLPLSVTIGVWLLRETGYTGEVRARVVTENATPAECAALGARIAAFPGRTALLVMGDGSARREEGSPGYVDPRGEPFDRAVATALAAADTAALAGLDPALARELLAPGRAPWQVLAGAAAGGRWRGDLLYAGAPYGVGYFVAAWAPEVGVQAEGAAPVGGPAAGGVA
jgi:hypothetical protein